MTKIFVAKLSPQTTTESLQALFEQYGEVSSSKVIIDRESGRSKCYGFVEMPDDEAGKLAIETLNGIEYEGSEIATKEAVPQDDYRKGGRPRSNFGDRNGGGFRPRSNFGDRNGGEGNSGGTYNNRSNGNRYESNEY